MEAELRVQSGQRSIIEAIKVSKKSKIINYALHNTLTCNTISSLMMLMAFAVRINKNIEEKNMCLKKPQDVGCIDYKIRWMN